MLSPLVTAGGCIGYLFEGKIPGTFCFVPEYCIETMEDMVQISELTYIHSGWDIRNMRFSDVLVGQHLFPNTRRPVADLDTEPVRTFLKRIEHIHGCCISSRSIAQIKPLAGVVE